MANIGIIGGGSVGMLTASLLANDHAITLYVKRSTQKNIINQKGIVLKQADKEIVVEIKTRLVEELKDADLFIICVKQPDLSGLLYNIAQIDYRTSLIFLQNGMSHLRQIEHLENPILLGVIEHGVFRESDHRIQYNGRGVLKLAHFKGDLLQIHNVTKQLHSVYFPIEIKKQYEIMLEEKLAINAVINPLTALFKIPNGDILKNRHINKLAKKLTKEVANSLGHDNELLWERILVIAKNTENNKSSMLQDVICKRPTEIESILGFIINKKTDNNSYITFLYHAISALNLSRE